MMTVAIVYTLMTDDLKSTCDMVSVTFPCVLGVSSSKLPSACDQPLALSYMPAQTDCG